MKVRFLGDANFDGRIIFGLKRADPAINLLTSDEARLRGVADPLVLLAASNDGRILLTHDRRTMRHHFADFIQKHDCPGVIIIGQNLPIKTAIEELLLIWSSSEAKEWVNSIVELPI